jgi:hypothetical protein
MKKIYGQTGRLWLLVALALVIGLVTIGMDANPASAAAKPALPFKYVVSGTVSPTGAGTFEVAATGVATFLGDVADAGNVVITATDHKTGVLTDSMREVLTAANGDTLTILCQETATPTSPGVYHGTDTWTVVGGTGRFSGATGSGTGDTYADLNAGKLTKSETGTITY